MPTRRTLLALAGSSASLALAGCSALEDDSDDTTGNGDDSSNGLQSDEGTRDTPRSGDGTAQSGSNENQQLREDIVDRYDEGSRAYNSGIRARNDAVAAWNDENNVTAERKSEDAAGHFSTARDHFSETLDMTFELGNSEAREICNTAVEAATLAEQAAQELATAAEHAQEGNIDLANDASDEASRLETEAQSLNIRTAETMASVLDV